MGKEFYTWEQIKSYSIIALHNLLYSANDINIKNMEMFIEPLKAIHPKNKVVKYSNYLLNVENNK